MQSTQSPGVDLENHGPEIIRVTVIFYILATFAVVTRLISRKLQKVHLRATDYTIMLGLLLAWGSAALTFIGILIVLFEQLQSLRCFLLGVSYGLGKHSEVLLSTDLIKLLQVRAHSVNKAQE